MQNAETVLDVLRERGRRGLPCTELYRQLFNPSLYLMAYGRLYSNHGAMTPGVDMHLASGLPVLRRRACRIASPETLRGVKIFECSRTPRSWQLSTSRWFPHAALVAVVRHRFDRRIRQFRRRVGQKLAGVVRRRLSRIDRRVLVRVQVRLSHRPILRQRGRSSAPCAQEDYPNESSASVPARTAADQHGRVRGAADVHGRARGA
jgi:hypothetical protein